MAAATTTAATMMEASTIAVVAMATMPATEEAMVTAMAAVRLGESCYFFCYWFGTISARDYLRQSLR